MTHCQCGGFSSGGSLGGQCWPMQEGQKCQGRGNGSGEGRGAMEGQFGKQMCPCCPSGVQETGRAVMSRELAKDEEVTLLGSQLCQGLRDLFLFTTLNLISSTIAPFISLSFSSFHVLVSLIVSGALVPGSLFTLPPPPSRHFSLGFISPSLFFKKPFLDCFILLFSPHVPPLHLRLNFFSLESL